MTINVIPGEISTFTIAIAILSGFILFFGYISMFLKEKLFLSEARKLFILCVCVCVCVSTNPFVCSISGGGYRRNYSRTISYKRIQPVQLGRSR